MIDLLWFIVAVIVAPYVIVGMGLGMFLVDANRIFRLPVLGAGVAAAGLGLIAWTNSTPDPKAEFLSLVEVFGQSSPLGIPMPYLCIAVAAALIAASIRRDRSAAR